MMEKGLPERFTFYVKCCLLYRKQSFKRKEETHNSMLLVFIGEIERNRSYVIHCV